MDKGSVAHTCNEGLFSLLNENSAICSDMNKSWVHDAKWNKLSEKDKCSTIPHTWST